MSRIAPHTRVPSYCLHKARGTAYVRLDGKVRYLPGKYGSTESRAEYDRLVGLWQLNGRQLPQEVLAHPLQFQPVTIAQAPHVQHPIAGRTVDELIDAFLTECEQQYQPIEGQRHSELSSLENAFACRTESGNFAQIAASSSIAGSFTAEFTAVFLSPCYFPMISGVLPFRPCRGRYQKGWNSDVKGSRTVAFFVK